MTGEADVAKHDSCTLHNKELCVCVHACVRTCVCVTERKRMCVCDFCVGDSVCVYTCRTCEGKCVCACVLVTTWQLHYSGGMLSV